VSGFERERERERERRERGGERKNEKLRLQERDGSPSIFWPFATAGVERWLFCRSAYVGWGLFWYIYICIYMYIYTYVYIYITYI